VFRGNLARIAAHNGREERGLETWRMAVTEFADLTEQEFHESLGGYIKTPASRPAGSSRRAAGRRDLPDTVDWRERGVVTEPKNQVPHCMCWSMWCSGQLWLVLGLCHRGEH
jgi:hypothetical protein